MSAPVIEQFNDLCGFYTSNFALISPAKSVKVGKAMEMHPAGVCQCINMSQGAGLCFSQAVRAVWSYSCRQG